MAAGDRIGSPRALLGSRAEQLASDYLVERGFEIVGRNVRVGRLELDVIGSRGRMIVFCEVRSRTSDRLMTPAQSIDARKVARLRQAAAAWLRTARRAPHEIRFDVASVLFDREPPLFHYLEGAF